MCSCIFFDVHQVPADPGSDALAERLAPVEVAELVHCETVQRLAGLAFACRMAPVPQKWIGSSVALGFDCGLLPARSIAPKEVQASVIVHIFDWGRSELNTVDKHVELPPEEQQDRALFWKYYVGGIDQLLWNAARAYQHRFTNSIGWTTLKATVIDFDSNTANDFLGAVELPLEETEERTVELLDTNGRQVSSRSGISTFTYAIERRRMPQGSRLAEVWRVHALRAANLPPMDNILIPNSDPFVELVATSEHGSWPIRFRQHTSVAQRNLNPEWLEVLEVPVMAASRASSAQLLERALNSGIPGLGTMENLGELLPPEGLDDATLERAFSNWCELVSQFADGESMSFSP